MIRLLSERLRPADPATRDAGLSIVEVVVALLVFAVITTGSLVAVGTVLAMSSDSRSREVAANLAAEAVDTARAVRDIDDIASGATTATINGTTFTVSQVVSWVTTKGVDSTCTPASAADNGALLYKRVNVSVSWSGMRASTTPVRSDTVVAPGSKINDPDRGSVLITVRGADGGGVPGVTVTIAPDPKADVPGRALTAESLPGLTNADGCAVAVRVVPGTYTVTLSRADGVPYRDPQQNATPVKTGISVARGDTSGHSFTYGPADDYTMNYASNYTGSTLLPGDLRTTITGSNGVTVPVGTDAHRYLYPLSSGYTFIAGPYVPKGGSSTSCLSPDPASWPVAADGRVGKPQQAVLSDVPVALPMGVTTVKLGSGHTFIKATTTTAQGGDPGCDATMTYTFQLDSAPGQATIALPFGTWKIQSARDSGSSLSAVTLGQLVGSFLGSLLGGTGASGNVVTLDPRVAP